MHPMTNPGMKSLCPNDIYSITARLKGVIATMTSRTNIDGRDASRDSTLNIPTTQSIEYTVPVTNGMMRLVVRLRVCVPVAARAPITAGDLYGLVWDLLLAVDGNSGKGWSSEANVVEADNLVIGSFRLSPVDRKCAV